jgi:hypothetical protein
MSLDGKITHTTIPHTHTHTHTNKHTHIIHTRASEMPCDRVHERKHTEEWPSEECSGEHGVGGPLLASKGLVQSCRHVARHSGGESVEQRSGAARVSGCMCECMNE